MSCSTARPWLPLRAALMAGLVLCAMAALAVPVGAVPAVDPPVRKVDWSISLDGQTARAQRVGRPFDVSFTLNALNADPSDYGPAGGKASFVVPEAFRILSAGFPYGAGSRNYSCDVSGQRIDCLGYSDLIIQEAIRVRLLPLYPVQNLASTISVAGVDSVEPDPDPNPNVVSFVTDVTSSLVDLSVMNLSTPDDVKVAQSVSYAAFVDSVGAIDPLSISATVKVPPGFAVTSAQWARQSFNAFGYGYAETGLCAQASQVVTCDLPWLSPTQSYYGYGYLGQSRTEQVILTVTGTHTVAGAGQATTFSVLSTSPYQAEVIPDPHPNSTSATVDVAPNVLPSTVSGTVTDPAGEGLPGVSILAYAPTDGFAPSAVATSGADGTYALDSLAPGSYALVYLPAAASGLPGQWAGGSTTRSGAALLTVDGSGNAVTGVNERLQHPASVAGTVRGPGGALLPGVSVVAFVTGVSWFPSASTVTDAGGGYRFDGLAPGSYDVVFRPVVESNLLVQWYRGQQIRSTADPIIITAGSNVTGIDADLVAGGGISGVVTGPGGAALPGVRVVAYGPGDTWVGSYETVTGPDGTYALAALRGADYQLRFVPPTASGLGELWYANTPSRGASTPVVVDQSTNQTGIDASWATAGVVPPPATKTPAGPQ